MAFNSKNWSLQSPDTRPQTTLSSGDTIGVPNRFIYYHPSDSKTTIAGSGYFNDAVSLGVRNGSIIEAVSGANGTSGGIELMTATVINGVVSVRIV